jgi:putative PIN family toxin of toxin-antitoxin system
VLRAVLDANVLASALIRPQGPPGQLIARLLEDEDFTLVISDSIFAELRRCLSYPRVRKYITATDEELDLWVTALGLVADIVEGKVVVSAVSDDPDDNKYLAAALEGRAEFVVSGDAHLLDLHEYEGIRILTPRAFLDLLKREAE